MAGDPRTILIANPGADLYGSDRMTVESVKALVALGYRVFVTVPAPGPLIDLLTNAGATVLVQPTPIIRKGLLSARGVLQLIREAVSAWVPSWRLLLHTDAGTIVVNTITPPLWLLLARLSGRRVFCHLHEAESSVAVLVRYAMYLPLQFCTGIVANSAYTKRVLAESSVGLVGRTSVVYNTVPGPPEVRPPRPVLTGAIRLLYVGRLSKRKGVHVAVAGMHQLRRRGVETQLDVVGAVFPGNESYEQDLRDLIDHLGLTEQIAFHGFQGNVWPYLADCDIAVVPATQEESFGNTATEAALAARPVVVSDIAGLKEATSASTSAVLVPSCDAVALADGIESIATDWQRYCGSAVADSVHVAARFSAARYAQELIGALRLAD